MRLEEHGFIHIPPRKHPKNNLKTTTFDQIPLFVAETLLSNKIDTTVIMQDWVDENCDGGLQGNLYFLNSPEAKETIDKFLFCMNVKEDTMPAENVTDAVIRWECK